MLVTIKQSMPGDTIVNMNSIDALFETDVRNGTQPVVAPITVSRPHLCRYKTFMTDEPNEHIHYEQLVTFKEYINRLYEKHPHPEEEYTHFKIPKKTHGFRQIDAPTDELKKDLKKIAEMLTGFLDICPHDAAWAYVKGRSVVGAMQEHTKNNSKWYLKLDLHNFFGSINKVFAVNTLLELYPFATAPEVCLIPLTQMFELGSLDGVLPQGTPLSPTLTNLIMVKYDYYICKMLARMGREGTIPKQRYVYTRYADDIIISAQTDFDFNKIKEGIEELFNDTPLSINNEKTRYGNFSGANWNLGVMCNQLGEVTTGHIRKDNLRGWIDNYIKALHNDEEWELTELQQLQGNLSWLHQVNPKSYDGLMRYVNKKYDRDVYATLLNDIRMKQQL